MKKNATYAKIIEEAVLYKTIKSNDEKEIELKFFNVSQKDEEALYSFIKTTFQHNGTLGYLYDAFNNVQLPMFYEHNFIAINNKCGSTFIVYGIQTNE